MNILFLHQNFPGQFPHLAPALTQRGHDVRALMINGAGLPDMPVYRYKPKRGSTPHIHPWVVDFESKIVRGEACAHACRQLRDKVGFVPDLIVSNPGWGESLFVKAVFPDARVLEYLEFFYAVKGQDVGFDTEFSQPNLATEARLGVKDATLLMAMHQMDAGISPTRWQWSTLPETYRSRVSVVFDGIDTEVVRPDAAASIEIAGQTFRAGEEIVTFINRNLEPYRGYHSFMRALPEIHRARPNARVIIVGAEGVSYGAAAPEGKSWKDIFLDEVKDRIDPARLLFVGRVPHEALIRLYQISAAHVYLTYPFVLSWSCVEALSAGCLVIGSSTAPVKEFVRDEENGLLFDFFKPDELARQVIRVLENPAAFAHMRAAARQGIVDGYDLRRHCLPQQIATVEGLLKG